MHAQLRQIVYNKIQKDQKPNCHLWRARGKSRVLKAKAGCWAWTLHTTPPERWANLGNHSSNPTSGHTLPPTLYKEQCRLPHLLGNKQGNLLLIFTPSCCSRSPNKALPEFLVWPFINFYWLRKARHRVLTLSVHKYHVILKPSFLVRRCIYLFIYHKLLIYHLQRWA